jgi:3-phosphoshikimate 1-carboxyvinyltransferase
MVDRRIALLATSPDSRVELPGSKSITNRALLAAGLARGSSSLRRVLAADDTAAMLDCVRALGATVRDDGGGSLEVEGISGLVPCAGRCFARQSGTTARFVAPVLALAPGPWLLDGDAQLAARPMGDLYGALRELGAEVSQEHEDSSLPAVIRGPARRREVAIAGNTSSQFLSGLLLAAPLFPSGLCVEVAGSLVSAPYVSMTLDVMERFGASFERSGARYEISPGGYQSTTLEIEPDASAASYFFAAAAITGGRVRVLGLGRGSVQGDLAFVDVLAAMGAGVEIAEGYTEVVAHAGLHGVEVDCGNFSDTVPTLAVVAAFADSPTRITGVGFIRAKESDRIGAVVGELRRCGVDAVEEPDGLLVRPGPQHGARVDSHGDHRLAMAFAVMGLRTPGIEILGAECVAKTFPEFFEVLDELRR